MRCNSQIRAVAWLAGMWVGNAAVIAHENIECIRRSYAEHAVTNKGDAAAGLLIFRNANKGACNTCHAVEGAQVLVGPSLGSIADKFEPRRLASAILNPSESIAIGFGTTKVLTEGQIYEGILQRVTDDAVTEGTPGAIVRTH